MFRAVNPFCIALGLVGAFVQIHRTHSAKSGPLVINKGLWVMIGGPGRFCSCGNVWCPEVMAERLCMCGDRGCRELCIFYSVSL